MSDIAEDYVCPTKVRDLIFAYERQVSSVDPPEDHYIIRHRARSIGNALSYKQFRQSNLEIHSLGDIEKELVKIETHLNYYEIYEKETHVAFQEQLFKVLTSIVMFEPEDHENSIQKIKNLIAETQKLARLLNSKLPFESQQGHRGIRKSYTDLTRRDEAIVSTTSVRNREQRPLTNGGFKSEESLNSTRDSVDSFRVEDASSVDFNRPETPEPRIVTETGHLSSVSRLKKFFSFRRDEKPNVQVTPTSYSGISRSQSLNLKTSRYTVVKKADEEHKKEESILEDQEEIKKSEPSNGDQTAEELESREEEKKPTSSVSNLKKLFEDKRKESDEGNYMNFTGLLRNVDIKKRADINKSKSLSDLKAESCRYTVKDLDDIDDDLSKQLDGVDDNEASENVNFSLGGKDVMIENDTSPPVVINTPNESFTFGKVEFLKKTFENLNNNNNVPMDYGVNIDVKDILHRTVEPIPGNEGDTEETLLKVPVQLRIGFNNVSSSDKTHDNLTYDDYKENNAEPVAENSTYQIHSIEDVKTEEAVEVEDVVASGTVETLKQTFEHLINTSIHNGSHDVEPVVEESATETEAEVSYDFEQHAKHQEAEETPVSSGAVEALKRTFESLSRSNSLETSEEAAKTLLPGIVASADSTIQTPKKILIKPELYIPDSGFSQAVLKHEEEQLSYLTLSSSSSDLKVEEAKVEPDYLKVPVQLMTEKNAAIYDSNVKENDGSSTVSISLYNGNSNTTVERQNSLKLLDRAQIESKTQNLLKILDTPVAYSTVTSGPDIQVEANMDDSKDNISLDLSTSQENVLDDILDRGESISNVLSTSQQNVLDDILNSGDMGNVDEEFDKLLQH